MPPKKASPTTGESGIQALEQTDITGQAKGPEGSGIAGYSYSDAPSGQVNAGYLGESSYGVHGVNYTGGGPAVYGESAATTGVQGASTAVGVQGTNNGGSGQGLPAAAGVIGDSSAGHGVYGVTASSAVWRAAGNSQNSILNSGVMGLNSQNGYGVSGASQGGYGVYALSFQNHAIYAVSGGTTAAVHVEGDLEVTGDVILLGSGSDCAEEFDTTAAVEIQPGTVVTFAGEDSVRESREAYDRTVAGVVSGAGSYRPGIILGKRPSKRTKVHVGLVGKAYCKVDAQYGHIRVGDLLTTSITPGHAMKATDPARAFGAVIGKALRNHDTGLGLIPILLALQ
jgi:hypothetical protein